MKSPRRSPPRAAASVLDRLLDAEPERERDPVASAMQTLVEFRRAVHRDVEHLLNARSPWHTPMSRALRSTPLGYGISDFTAGAFNDVRERERLRAEIVDVLQRFEPRLADLDVKIIDDGMPLQGMMRLRISAMLLAEPLPEAIAGTGDVRAPQDGLREILLALVGYTDGSLLARLQTGIEPLLYYSGAFAARPRSATRLAAILSDWLGQTVEIDQFSGSWLEIAPDQRSSLPTGKKGTFNQLGVDAVSGAWVWDIPARIMLRIGPLDLDLFKALMPDGALLRRVIAFTRAYLGMEVDFVINPILAAHAVPAPALGPMVSPAILGWTGWLPVSRGRKNDAKEARFREDQISAGSG